MRRLRRKMALVAACVLASVAVHASDVNAYADGEMLSKMAESPLTQSEEVEKNSAESQNFQTAAQANVTKKVEPYFSVADGLRRDVIYLVFKRDDKIKALEQESFKGFRVQGVNGINIVRSLLIEKFGTVQLTFFLDGDISAKAKNIKLVYEPNLISNPEALLKIEEKGELFPLEGFEVKVNNQLDPGESLRVESVKVDGKKAETTTSRIEIKFSSTPKVVLKAKDFELSNATVTDAQVKSPSEKNIYILQIADVKSVNQTLSTKKVDYEFVGELNFQVHVKEMKKDNSKNDQDKKNENKAERSGGGGRSSVRPDSSAPAKKEDAKKDEMKNEPKKNGMKKDEVNNATSTDKVSTKLVIGQKTYTAMVNGQAVEKTMDVAPMVHQGRTVLPARMISELLGVDVKFDQKSKTANFMYGEAKVQLTLGQKFMLVNGEKAALSADILNKDGRILLPVTDIQKAFAKLGLTANVSWDADTKSVTVNK